MCSSTKKLATSGVITVDTAPNFTAETLADIASGALQSECSARFTAVRPLDDAGPADVAFLLDKRRVADARTSGAGLLIVPAALSDVATPQIVCDDVGMALARVLQAFAEKQAGRRHPGISPRASISPSATIGPDVIIGDFVVIGDGAVVSGEATIHAHVTIGRNVRVGRRTTLHPGVHVLDSVLIGDDCIIHAGTVLGADGFGLLQRDGRNVKLAHLGTVRIGCGVEIGALCTVDRGMMQDTVIGDGFKCDDHCHIGHNCLVGPHGVMAAGCLLGGSVEMGRGAMLGGHCAVRDHVRIGDGAQVAGNSGVTADVPDGGAVVGFPTHPLAEQRRVYAHMRRLPEMARQLRELRKTVMNDE
jgi:UDP-3-O-[3-hydroxymyristoyl] glucosamine N-acyltransferase